MKYFLDTEFHEMRGSIELISIGLVAEDGRTYYAVNKDYDWDWASEWLIENVKPHLDMTVDNAKTLSQIAQDILDFTDDNPQFWGYYADYDWVVFCWLYGAMIDLPVKYPMCCFDLKQVIEMTKLDPPPQEGIEHNALQDALWIKDSYDWIEKEVIYEAIP